MIHHCLDPIARNSRYLWLADNCAPDKMVQSLGDKPILRKPAALGIPLPNRILLKHFRRGVLVKTRPELLKIGKRDGAALTVPRLIAATADGCLPEN